MVDVAIEYVFILFNYVYRQFLEKYNTFRQKKFLEAFRILKNIVSKQS